GGIRSRSARRRRDQCNIPARPRRYRHPPRTRTGGRMTVTVDAMPRSEQSQASGDRRHGGATVEATNKWIGQSVTRLEDPPLVRGRGRFAGDISFPHQLHMRIVRANYAHGNIAAIDSSAARALAGVVAVWTAADIADVPPIDFREGPIPALEPYRQPVLATEKVRYVGEPVAAVFADDPYVAEDAAELVSVKIEELPVLLAADADPAEFSAGRSTEVSIIRQGYG